VNQAGQSSYRSVEGFFQQVTFGPLRIPQSQMRLNAGLHLLELKGLCDVVDAARLKSPDFVLGLIQRA
jgi:hypothetical protein